MGVDIYYCHGVELRGGVAWFVYMYCGVDICMFSCSFAACSTEV